MALFANLASRIRAAVLALSLASCVRYLVVEDYTACAHKTLVRPMSSDDRFLHDKLRVLCL